jgi:hypothetical protein
MKLQKLSLLLIVCLAQLVAAHSRYSAIAHISVDPAVLSQDLSAVPRTTVEAMRPSLSAQTQYFTILNLFGRYDRAQVPASPFIIGRAWTDFQLFPGLPELMEQIKQVLAEFKKLEPLFVTSFSGADMSRQQALSPYYLGRAPAEWPQLQIANKLLDQLDNSLGRCGPVWNS